jgi:hypothetical protein
MRVSMPAPSSTTWAIFLRLDADPNTSAALSTYSTMDLAGACVGETQSLREGGRGKERRDDASERPRSMLRRDVMHCTLTRTDTREASSFECDGAQRLAWRASKPGRVTQLRDTTVLRHSVRGWGYLARSC